MRLPAFCYPKYSYLCKLYCHLTSAMSYRIVEVASRKDLDRFVRFPDDLYRSCGQYVPALHKDQKDSLTKVSTLSYCERKMWLAMDGDKVVGRICGMVNPRYNELYGKKLARFGWFDTIDDIEVAKLLLCTAEDWARQMGMTGIHGPLYYNTLGKQGMLVEGFDRLPVFNTLYNYSYYNDFVTGLGYEKECDWLEYRMAADQDVPEKMQKMSSILMEKHDLHEADIDILKKDKEQVRRFFQAYNESFAGNVHNFIPFTDAEIEEEAATFIPFLSNRTSVVLMDGDENLVAFGIAVPDLSKAFQKARGKLFPTGWFHLLRALKDYETMDLMITGAVPEWQNTGISAVLHCMMSRKFKALGSRWAIANPQIETNIAVNVWAKYGVSELYCRRRCYIKKLI